MPSKKKWSLENIQTGFNKFENEHGRLPTSLEIDKIKDLPSSRQIQRVFGGLPNLRKTLGYVDTHFGAGEFRSKIGIASNNRARVSEAKLRKFLVDYFCEAFVHVERPIGEFSKTRLDFYIYSRTKNFGIDIFTTETIHDLHSNLTMKSTKYTDFHELLYFVVDSETLSQSDMDNYHIGKIGRMLPNMKLISFASFLSEMKNFDPYKNPIKE